MWTEGTLELAEAVRRNQPILVDDSDQSTPLNLAERLGWLRKTYPSIAHRFYTETEPRVEAGRQVLLAHARESSRIADAQDRENPHRRDAQSLAALAERHLPADNDDRGTLHDALTQWGAAMEKRYQKDGIPTKTGLKFQELALRLKRAHPDIPLCQLTYGRIESFVDHWCSRPDARNSRGESKERPISVATVKSTLKNLRRFLRWLHRCEDFDWHDRDRIIEDATAARPVSTMLSPEERKAMAAGPESWTLEELTVLYRHATQRDRLLILLGLNGGFAQSEIIHLAKEEVFLDEDPPHIAFVRNKSGRRGGFALWPETVAALKQNRKIMGKVGPKSNPWEVLTASGQPYSTQRIVNIWTGLLGRVRKEQPEFRRLPFKYLRKTAAALVQDQGGSSEIIALMEARAKRSEYDDHADAYYRRIIERVFPYNLKVREYLEPMFAAADPAD